MTASSPRKPCKVCGEPRSHEVKGIRREGRFHNVLEAFCSEECLEVRIAQLGLDGWALARETPSRLVFRHTREFVASFTPAVHTTAVRPDNSPQMFLLHRRGRR